MPHPVSALGPSAAFSVWILSLRCSQYILLCPWEMAAHWQPSLYIPARYLSWLLDTSADCWDLPENCCFSVMSHIFSFSKVSALDDTRKMFFIKTVSYPKWRSALSGQFGCGLIKVPWRARKQTFLWKSCRLFVTQASVCLSSACYKKVCVQGWEAIGRVHIYQIFLTKQSEIKVKFLTS